MLSGQILLGLKWFPELIPPNKGKDLDDPSKALPANMINALKIDEMDNIEQRKSVCVRVLGAVVSVNLRVVWLDK